MAFQIIDDTKPKKVTGGKAVKVQESPSLAVKEAKPLLEPAAPKPLHKEDIKRAWGFIYPRLKSVWAKWPAILEHVENIERWLE